MFLFPLLIKRLGDMPALAGIVVYKYLEPGNLVGHVIGAFKLFQRQGNMSFGILVKQVGQRQVFQETPAHGLGRQTECIGLVGVIGIQPLLLTLL